jgi:hypothetical protein
MINRQFITAGRSIFTVKSGRTGEHVTYRVAHKAGTDKFPPAWFIFVLTGPDNTSDYTFLGLLDPETGRVRLSRSSKFTEDSRPVKVVRWALEQVWKNRTLPAGYEIHHEGRCGKCGRLLTTPTSCKLGIGPECMKSL